MSRGKVSPPLEHLEVLPSSTRVAGFGNRAYAAMHDFSDAGVVSPNPIAGCFPSEKLSEHTGMPGVPLR